MFKKGGSAKVPRPFATWSPQVGLLTTVWHPSLELNCLLATGTASGLGRVDWVDAMTPSSRRRAAAVFKIEEDDENETEDEDE